jgi:tripartite-type tricarboxylate transporter receptor subunit TctC
MVLALICAGLLACTPAAPAAPPAPAATTAPTVAAKAGPPTSAPAAPTAAAAKTAPVADAKPVAAADPARMKAYFEGKTVELYIGYAPGGGIDIRARLFAEFFGRHIPGNPRVTVVNLAGGGGLTAARQVMRAKPDGLTLVVIPAGVFISELLGEDQEGFEVSQPVKLGNYEPVAEEYTTIMVRTELATTWEQMVAAGKQGRKFKLGAPAIGNSQALAGEWLSAVGAPIEVVYGYGGGSEVLAAVDRKELDLYATDQPAPTREASFIRMQENFPEWLQQEPKFVTPVLSTRAKGPQAWFDPFGYTAPPTVLEAVESTQAQKDAYRLAFQVREGVDPVSLPPGVPDDVRETLKQAVRDAAEDPGFKAAMEQRGFRGGYRTPEEQDEGLTGLQKAPKEVVDIVRRMYLGK